MTVMSYNPKTSKESTKDKPAKEEKKKQKSQKKDEKTEIASLSMALRVLNINLELYIEDYVLENYFKLYHLLPFQMKGSALTPYFIVHFSLMHLLILFFFYSPFSFSVILGWVVNNRYGKLCHRPCCRHISTKKPILILSEDLKNYKKCSHCQPLIMKLPHKHVEVAM
jgi:hypothetical protein